MVMALGGLDLELVAHLRERLLELVHQVVHLHLGVVNALLVLGVRLGGGTALVLDLELLLLLEALNELLDATDRVVEILFEFFSVLLLFDCLV